MLNKLLNVAIGSLIVAVIGFYVYNNDRKKDEPIANNEENFANTVKPGKVDTLYAEEEPLPPMLAEDTVALPLIPKNGVTAINWEVLKGTRFEERMYEDIGEKMLFPIFGDTLKRLNGTLVSIKGYIIPLDEETGLYALSGYPMAACFFCGGAGPESVLGLKFKSKKRKNFLMDMRCTFKGRLRLNDTDIDDFNYILEDAELIFEED